LPIVTCDSDFNFTEISRLLQQAGGLKKVDDAQQLARQINAWVSQESLRESMGGGALSVMESNRGALDGLFNLLTKNLCDS
jgi:3-deoxy-D-manno-octulosonic-acid transferase